MGDIGADAEELLADLVSIDSVNPGLVAGGAGEQRIVDRLASRLARSGFTVTVVPAPGREGRPSLVAVPSAAAAGPTVVLNGHLDTNAVTHLGRLLHVVDERASAVRAQGGDLMVTVVSGGSSAFVVPDHAECLVEMRTTPERSSADALAEVRALLDPRWQADAELVAARDGWRMDGEGPAATLGAALGARLGTGPTFDAPYWMEAPLWQQVCPTLVCGPSGGGLHAVDEWVDLGQVRAFTDALVHAVGAWR